MPKLPKLCRNCAEYAECASVDRTLNSMRKFAVCSVFAGGVPERSKGADCKSAGSAFGGSNPPPSTRASTGGDLRAQAGVVQWPEPQPSKLMMWVRFPSPAPKADVAAVAEVVEVVEVVEARGLPSAHIAQSVEHFLGKEEVTGSNPVVGSSRQNAELLPQWLPQWSPQWLPQLKSFAASSRVTRSRGIIVTRI